ncbi:MAG TPA: glycosyltransferase family 2 protein [Puia sp.]
MNSLSVVIITFNEEKNIKRCIDSVKTVADEVIVMDSFSADKTGEIAKELGAKFFLRTFTGYGDQKNTAAGYASNDNILYLDADEFLSPELIRAIEEQKEMGFPFDGYTMNRLNNYCGKWIRHGSWYPDKKLRLVNRDRGAWNLDLVHESLEMKEGSYIHHLKGDLLHYTYSNFDEHVEKNIKYSWLSAQLLYKRGKRVKAIKAFINPFWAFITSYFLRAGFLDGFYGFVIAVNIAHLTFLKYTRLYQLQQEQKSS